MLAAVTVYLLIAFSFATIYNIAFQLDFKSFRFPEWIEAGSAEILRTEMIYFSLVTLATLGYGDILPSSPFTQMLAVRGGGDRPILYGGVSGLARGDVHLRQFRRRAVSGRSAMVSASSSTLESPPVRWRWTWRLVIGLPLLGLGMSGPGGSVRRRQEHPLCPRAADARLRTARDGAGVRCARPARRERRLFRQRHVGPGRAPSPRPAQVGSGGPVPVARPVVPHRRARHDRRGVPEWGPAGWRLCCPMAASMCCWAC